jgi:hypothetical protein
LLSLKGRGRTRGDAPELAKKRDEIKLVKKEEGRAVKKGQDISPSGEQRDLLRKDWPPGGRSFRPSRAPGGGGNI